MFIKSITSTLDYGYGKFVRTTDFGKFKDKYVVIQHDYQQGKLIDKTMVVWNDVMQRIFKKGNSGWIG